LSGKDLLDDVTGVEMPSQAPPLDDGVDIDGLLLAATSSSSSSSRADGQ
jgi:hypothetical protein